RSDERVALVEAYCKENLLWHDASVSPDYSQVVELDLSSVEPSLAGPRRPQDRVPLARAKESFIEALGTFGVAYPNSSYDKKVVTEYYEKAGLDRYLDALGFNTVGYGCTTCIGNSGPLPDEISDAVNEGDLVVCSVLSGNRNFEARIHPEVKANYLASPPLVVAYSLAGRMDIDLLNEPLGQDPNGDDVFLHDVWPSAEEIQETITASVRGEMYSSTYADVFTGDDQWRGLPVPAGERFAWDPGSTYVRQPP